MIWRLEGLAKLGSHDPGDVFLAFEGCFLLELMPAAASLKLQVFGWWVRAAGLLIRPKARAQRLPCRLTEEEKEYVDTP